MSTLFIIFSMLIGGIGICVCAEAKNIYYETAFGGSVYNKHFKPYTFQNH